MRTLFGRRSAAFLALLAACASANPVIGAAPARGRDGVTHNPLWRAGKVKNYLPDMRWPEVRDLITRTDIVIIPVGALEQHGPTGPIGTDFLNSVEQAKLIAQRTDVLVAPILMPGNSPYHMEFPGTITLPMELIQQVYFEAAKSLMRTGFKRFIIYNGHGGNEAICQYLVDRINQETGGEAVELNRAAAPFLPKSPPAPKGPKSFDRHGGVDETSRSMFLTPDLVDLTDGRKPTLTYPPYLDAMVPDVKKGDPTASMIFLAETLKDKNTGKHVSTREMSDTGSWTELDTRTSSPELGKKDVDAFVGAAVAFIERWKQLEPLDTKR